MKKLLLGVLVGAALVVGGMRAVVAYYMDAIRYAGNVPRARLTSLPPCSEETLRWRAGMCATPREDAGMDYRDVAIPTPRGVTVRGWWVPTREAAPAVIFAHGVGSDRREGLRFLKVIRDAGWSTLLLDLSNHGTSDNDGSGARYGAVERLDVLAAATFLRERERVPRVVAFGISMGGASALLAAASDDK